MYPEKSKRNERIWCRLVQNYIIPKDAFEDERLKQFCDGKTRISSLASGSKTLIVEMLMDFCKGKKYNDKDYSKYSMLDLQTILFAELATTTLIKRVNYLESLVRQKNFKNMVHKRSGGVRKG